MKATSNVYLLGFMFTLCIVIIDSSCNSNYPSRQRSTRGFKNAALSTARGFGKRDGFFRDSDATMDFLPDSKKGSGEDLSKVLSNSERYSMDWLVEELLKNPHFVRLILINRRRSRKNEEVAPEEMPSEGLPRDQEY